MKVQTLFNLTVGIFTLSSSLISPLPLKADAGDPNGPNNTQKSGWSLWQRWDKLKSADLDFGLSNLDLGLDLDLQNQCFGEVNSSTIAQKKLETYWYRISDDINKIGTGQIEYGCWIGGRFKSTITTTAIKISLESNPCFRVTSASQQGLAIHLEPNTKSRLIGRVRNGETVKPSSVPVIVRTAENYNWIEIESPVRGWISNGTPNSKGNLILCQS